MPLSDTFCFSGPCRTVDSGATSLGNWNNRKQHNFLEDRTENWKTEKHETLKKNCFQTDCDPPPASISLKIMFLSFFQFFFTLSVFGLPPHYLFENEFLCFSFFPFLSVFFSVFGQFSVYLPPSDLSENDGSSGFSAFGPTTLVSGLVAKSLFFFVFFVLFCWFCGVGLIQINPDQSWKIWQCNTFL